MRHEQGLQAQGTGLWLGLGGGQLCSGGCVCWCVWESVHTAVHVCTTCALIAVPVPVSTSFVPRVGAGLGKSAPEASGTLGVECCHTCSGTACA